MSRIIAALQNLVYGVLKLIWMWFQEFPKDRHRGRSPKRNRQFGVPWQIRKFRRPWWSWELWRPWQAVFVALASPLGPATKAWTIKPIPKKHLGELTGLNTGTGALLGQSVGTGAHLGLNSRTVALPGQNSGTRALRGLKSGTGALSGLSTVDSQHAWQSRRTPTLHFSRLGRDDEQRLPCRGIQTGKTKTFKN